MLNKTAYCLLLVFLTGCDTGLKQNRSFKWAFIDNSKIQTVLRQKFKNDYPYPAEINQDIEAVNKEYSRLLRQVADLERSARQNCKSSIPNDDKAQRAKPHVSDDRIITYGPGDVVVLPAFSDRNDYKAQLDPAYQECIKKIKSDQLIVDLEEKAKKLQGIRDARRKHDLDVSKKTDEAIDIAVAKYAEFNGYQLILTNRSSSIAYNGDKVTIDVTDDVLDSLLKNQINTKIDKDE